MNLDQEMVAFHYQLGAAIAQWASIELVFAHILVSGFKHENLQRESLAIGFLAIEGFRTKLIFMNNAVTRKLAGSPHTPEWSKLVDRAKNLSQSRNKLAHWSIGKFPQAPAGQRVVLMPWITTKGQSADRPPKGSLTTRDIGKLGNEFLAFAVKLENFLGRLCGQPEPHAKSDEQASSQPTTQSLVRQIRGVVAPPQKPSRRKS